MRPSLRLIILAVGTAVFVTACGASDEPVADPPTSTDSMSDMADMNMGNADATPAEEVAGADLKTAAFELLSTRPEGHDDTSGTAGIARSSAGTTLTLRLTGLQPGSEYIAHLHEGTCSENGGAHYKFDPAGGDDPPNEIHLGFTAGEDGFMTAENATVAGSEGRSVVVHPVDLLDNKLACAQFS
ncbi:MAG: superoxide dismutase family protein [Acidimicrobiia bacterium]|nr:superoxide dismutase family protein [Acidimicrobiia bacterium]